jgi:glycine/D-amino acid oxidase-like deaminating enzyme
MKKRPHVAVLGCGIMGSATALFLARRGARVSLFDASRRPFDGASRWNEGKIHLGYLYSADPSFETARRLLPGGLAFKALTEELIGCPLDGAMTGEDDTYLVHRQSVVTDATIGRYCEAVTALIQSHPEASRYLVDLTAARVQRLTPAELNRDYDPAAVVGGYRVPERSVSTVWIADRFASALAADPRIELALETRVLAVAPAGESRDGPFLVETTRGPEGLFDFVVNALWDGRPAIDAGLGLLPAAAWSHRFRLSMFLRTRATVTMPSTLIGIGPFGDIKNYNGRDLYLSWYTAGLVAEGSGLAPPRLPELNDADRGRIKGEIFRRLGEVIPAVRDLEAGAEMIQLGGGWVYAVGTGPLNDARSTLHRRDQIGIQRTGSYFSVDTGKYSIAPWLARQVADAIIA